MTHASFQNAKFARAPMLFTISKRKICTYTRPAPNQSAICTTTFATEFPWSLVHVRTQNLHVHLTHASFPNAKFARAQAPCFISKRKICTCTQAPHQVHTQNLHVRDVTTTYQSAIYTTTCATGLPWSLVHAWTPNLHGHMTPASIQNAKFARAQAPCRRSKRKICTAHAPCCFAKRKICTCTQANHHFQTQNLHAHVK